MTEEYDRITFDVVLEPNELERAFASFIENRAWLSRLMEEMNSRAIRIETLEEEPE